MLAGVCPGWSAHRTLAWYDLCDLCARVHAIVVDTRFLVLYSLNDAFTHTSYTYILTH